MPGDTKQLEIRAQMDTETVKALLLINGGGAVALLTLFSALLSKDGYEPLARVVLIGVLVLMVGLASTVIHNKLRRDCSLHFQHHNMTPPSGKLWGINLGQPCVCAASRFFMWLSLALFLAAGTAVAVYGIAFIPPKAAAPATVAQIAAGPSPADSNAGGLRI